MRARKELAEVVSTHRNHHWQADCRPDGITTANPIPETEDAVFANTEGCNLIKCCGNSREMCANCIFSQRISNPFARGLRVGHGFDGGESLGRDNDECRCRIKRIERVGNMCAINVGDIMRAWAIMIRGQRQRRHNWAKIGTADADIDDIGDLLARRALDRAGTDAIREGSHAVENFLHVRKNVMAIDQHFLRRGIAQCNM